MVMENRYDKYKDSGIAWIGEIPKHWEVRRMKSIYNFGKGLNITKADLVNKGIPVISYGQIHSKLNTGTCIKDSLIKYVPESFLENNNTSLVKKGDIIFADTSEDLEGCGNCIYIDRDMLLYAGYHTIIAKNISTYINKYFSYLFQTDCWRTQIRKTVNGVKLFSIPQRLLASTDIITPSTQEQQSIATYLDQKCGEIDELMTLQEEMITKLQSYKQSVITEAVTKGLDKNVPLKDSGIEWIGEIPEHWEASKTLFNLSMPITDGPHTTPELFEIGIPFVSAEAVSFGNGRIDFSRIRGYISENFYQECCKKYVPQVDDIYMIKSGATTGRVAIVDTDIKFTIWSPLAVFRCNKERMLPRFLFYQLQSNGYQKQIELNWSYGTQQNIGMRTLEKLILSVPPLSEQQSIADYLDQKCSEIDELISIKQQKIEKLKDYKKSLIFECVTGKRKVS